MDKNNDSSVQHALNWIKRHPKESFLGLIVLVIVYVVGATMIAGKSPSLLGFSLRPMYQQASCDPKAMDCNPGIDSNGLGLTATFSPGTVNAPYSTKVSLVNPTGKCSFSLDSVNPKISGATLSSNPEAVTNSKQLVNSTTAVFQATPVTAGDYKVVVSATCNPIVGDGPSSYVQKSFAWTVNPTKLPPQTSIDIVGKFGIGKTNQPYTAPVATIYSIPNYTCTLSLVKVSPEIKGAALVPVPRMDSAMRREAEATFTATPTKSGKYTAVITATCDPSNPQSKMKSIVVNREFTWSILGSAVRDTK